MKPVFTELVDEFEQTTRHKLTISYVPAGAAKSRIEAGETFDVAILQRPAAEELAQQGKINSRGMTTLSRSGLALAIRQGMTKPDISTIEAFKRALLEAKSISYPDPAQGHAAGAHFSKIIDRLGIAAQINAKAKLQKRAFLNRRPRTTPTLPSRSRRRSSSRRASSWSTSFRRTCRTTIGSVGRPALRPIPRNRLPR